MCVCRGKYFSHFLQLSRTNKKINKYKKKSNLRVSLGFEFGARARGKKTREKNESCIGVLQSAYV